MRIAVAILTISDRCSRGEAEDLSGPALQGRVVESLGGEVVHALCVPDELDEITETIRRLATDPSAPSLILTTGGTGLAPRDVTPEATLRVLKRQHPGLMELIRSRCGLHHARAYLSRGVAGTVGRTLVINLPGSERGAIESFDAVAEILPHAIGVLTGSEPGHPPAESQG